MPVTGRKNPWKPCKKCGLINKEYLKVIIKDYFDIQIFPEKDLDLISRLICGEAEIIIFNMVREYRNMFFKNFLKEKKDVNPFDNE